MLRGSALTFSATLVVNLSMLAFHFVLIRKLQPDAYGVLYTMASIIALTAVIGSIGTNVVARHAAHLAAARGDDAMAPLTTLVAGVGTCAAILAAPVAALFAPPLARFLNTPSVDVVSLTLVTCALQLSLLASRGLLQGAQRFGNLSISLIAEAVLRTAIAVWFAVAYGGAISGIWGYFWSTVSAVAVTVMLAFRITGFRWSLRNGKADGLYGVFAGATAATLALAGFTWIDVLLVKHFFDPQVAGLYSAVAVVGKMALFASSFVPMLVLPRATQLSVQGRGVRRLLWLALSIAALLSAGVLIAFVAAPAIVGLLIGARLHDAVPYVPLYTLAMGFLGASTVAVAYRIGVHSYRFLPFSYAIFAGEIAAIALWHSSIQQVIGFVAAFNALNLLAALLFLREDPNQDSDAPLEAPYAAEVAPPVDALQR